VDWEVLRSKKTQGHFLLTRKMATTVTDLQLWLLEAMLGASHSDEIEAQQLLRLPELFPFALTVNVGDLRKHEGFNIHRQGLDMDMVSVRQVKVEPPPKLTAKQKKSKTEPDQPELFDEPKQDAAPSAGPSPTAQVSKILAKTEPCAAEANPHWNLSHGNSIGNSRTSSCGKRGTFWTPRTNGSWILS